MTAIASFGVVALDCREPRSLAAFYSAILGVPVEHADEEWVKLAAVGGVALAFQLAPDHVAPQWPDPRHPQQLHLDFYAPDLDAAERQVLAIGGRKHEHQPGTDFRVFLDPAGHPFCLCQG